MINLFVSMAATCKLILETKLNQIMSYFLVFLSILLLPFNEKVEKKFSDSTSVFFIRKQTSSYNWKTDYAEK